MEDHKKTTDVNSNGSSIDTTQEDSDSSWLVEPYPLTEQLNTLLSEVANLGKVTPEALEAAVKIIEDTQKIAIHSISSCTNLIDCGTYDGRCPRLEKCGTYSSS